MSLETRIVELAQAIGADMKLLQDAVNSAVSGSTIDDSVVSTETSWSSAKTSGELAELNRLITAGL